MDEETINQVIEELRKFSTPPLVTLEKFRDLEAANAALQQELLETKAQLDAANNTQE